MRQVQPRGTINQTRKAAIHALAVAICMTACASALGQGLRADLRGSKERTDVLASLRDAIREDMAGEAVSLCRQRAGESPGDPLRKYALAMAGVMYLQIREAGLDKAKVAAIERPEVVKAAKRCQELAPSKVDGYLAEYWATVGIEWPRTDQPNSKRSEWVTRGDGSRIRMEVWSFSGPDPAQIKRRDALAAKIKSMAPGDPECLYIQASLEADPARSYTLFEQSYSSGGKGLFSPNIEHQLASVAKRARMTAEFQLWEQRVRSVLQVERTNLIGRMFLARNPGYK